MGGLPARAGDRTDAGGGSDVDHAAGEDAVCLRLRGVVGPSGQPPVERLHQPLRTRRVEEQ